MTSSRPSDSDRPRLRRRGDVFLRDCRAAKDIDDDTLQRQRRILGEDHADTLDTANDLGEVLHEMGDFAAARDLHQETLPVYA
ncbi:MAG: tetratricopeptide repeat protein [Streptosporangiaceae bacterium]